MEFEQFKKLKKRFYDSNVEEKVSIYVKSQGLSTSQYKELLSIFPMSELGKLENALDNIE